MDTYQQVPQHAIQVTKPFKKVLDELPGSRVIRDEDGRRIVGIYHLDNFVPVGHWIVFRGDKYLVVDPFDFECHWNKVKAGSKNG